MYVCCLLHVDANNNKYRVPCTSIIITQYYFAAMCHARTMIHIANECRAGECEHTRDTEDVTF